LANIRNILLARESGEWYAEEYDLPIINLTPAQSGNLLLKYGHPRNIAPITGKLMSDVYAVVYVDRSTGKEVIVGIPPFPDVFRPIRGLGISVDIKAETFRLKGGDTISTLVIEDSQGHPVDLIEYQAENDESGTITELSDMLQSILDAKGYQLIALMTTRHFEYLTGVDVSTEADFVAVARSHEDTGISYN
jgi:hypothetical protein